MGQEGWKEGNDRRVYPRLQLGFSRVLASDVAHRRIFTLHFTHLPCQRVTYAHTDTHTHSESNPCWSPWHDWFYNSWRPFWIAQPWQEHTSVSTLAGPFHPLNKQPSRNNLSRDQWRLYRWGIKHVCLSMPTESIEKKLYSKTTEV